MYFHVNRILCLFYDDFVAIAGELNWALKKSGTVESSLNAFLATGNLSSTSGLGLLQDKGMFHISLISLSSKDSCLSLE
jgi:hypothetical protein